MARMGVPSSSSFGSAVGAPGSNTELGPPERMMAFGSNCLMNLRSVPRAAGGISQYTGASRTRGAISWVNRDPYYRLGTDVTCDPPGTSPVDQAHTHAV